MTKKQTFHNTQEIDYSLEKNALHFLGEVDQDVAAEDRVKRSAHGPCIH